MKLSMHNWMRQEPIEKTIARLGRAGFDGIEIMGEPALYDAGRVRDLLQTHGLVAFGVVPMMTRGRDLIHPDKDVRVGTVTYCKECVRLAADLGGEIVSLVPARDWWGHE